MAAKYCYVKCKINGNGKRKLILCTSLNSLLGDVTHLLKELYYLE